MCMVAHLQGLAAPLTVLFQRGQLHRVRRFWTRSSSGHGPSPAVLALFLLSLPASFSFQTTPAVKLSFPFRFFLGWQTLSEDGKLRALLLTHDISPVEREY